MTIPIELGWKSQAPTVLALFFLLVATISENVRAEWVGQRLQSRVTDVNPFKGLVFYSDASDGVKPTVASGAMSLEFTEMPYR